jgi:hypothetical protein
MPPLVPDPTSNLKPSASGSGVLEPPLVLVASFHVSNGRRLQFVTLFQTRSRQYSSKHSKSFPLIDCISVDVDRMQRNFEPMRKRVEAWKKNELTGVDREGGHLRSFRGRQTGNAKARCPHRA